MSHLVIFLLLALCPTTALRRSPALRHSPALHHSRVLLLRGGGGVAAPVTLNAALELSVVEGLPSTDTASAATGAPMIGLGSSDLAALNLTSGERVRITKTERSTSSPNELLAEAVADDAALEGSIRVPRGVMQAVQLRAGDAVLVAAYTEATAESGQVVGHRRRYPLWLRAILWLYAGTAVGYVLLKDHIEN